jgi:glutathione peroxidase
MTFRQRVMKFLYPLIMKIGAKKPVIGTAKAIVPFYSLTTSLNNGKVFNFDSVKGKKVLIVNTASNCGYTNQYEDLEKLAKQYADKLVVLGFPANDFKNQEAASDAEIANFCQVNFGVTFPLMKKSVVVKAKDQNPVFEWLSDASLNGWNNQAPTWNFCKYLINAEGQLTHFFAQTVSPLSAEVVEAIK